MLAISIYDGKSDNISFFTRICEIEGSAVPEGRPPYTVFEEAAKVLEACADKYNTPRPAGEYITVFVGRKAGTEVSPLMRLNVHVQGGQASAYMIGEGPRRSTEPVAVATDDDVATIVRKILAEYLEP
jgi:hypothetical protein